MIEIGNITQQSNAFIYSDRFNDYVHENNFENKNEDFSLSHF